MPRLGHEIRGTALHSLDGCVDAAVRRDHYNDDVGIDLDNALEPSETLFAGRFPGPEVHVEQDGIEGVAPTQNITGLFNAEKAWMYIWEPDFIRIGSVRITGGNIMDSVEQIEEVWDRVIPDYPMQGRFLDNTFDDVYNILKYMNMSLAGFAFIALSLALIGLFGLAAFMAAQRTKEIGVRKVLGASSFQIARLLVWQFSKPVLWGLAVALPGAYFASSLYLNFFADRIEAPIPILLVAGTIAVMLAWGTVAAHAIRIARANPIHALRYE